VTDPTAFVSQGNFGHEFDCMNMLKGRFNGKRDVIYRHQSKDGRRHYGFVLQVLRLCYRFQSCKGEQLLALIIQTQGVLILAIETSCYSLLC